MGIVVKILVAAAALFFAFGGPHRLKKSDKQNQPQQETPATAEKSPQKAEITISQQSPVLPETATAFHNAPDNLLASTEWLQKNSKSYFEIQNVHLTYYLIARSDRCQVDSLGECIQKAVRSAGIDQRDFQYTYFFDRVIVSGSGLLFWQGNGYTTSYDRLLKAGWNSGARNLANNYTCSGFAFTSKKPIEFIQQNLGNKSVFTPIKEARFPNGATSTGREAVDWHTVSINLHDFPLSVPEKSLREKLTERYTRENKRVPVPRSFIVIVSADNRMFLTEPIDTGSGVKEKSIDWRIGNTSAEIRYFHNVGSSVKAVCYTFSDPDVTFEKVLAQSRTFTAK